MSNYISLKDSNFFANFSNAAEVAALSNEPAIVTFKRGSGFSISKVEKIEPHHLHDFERGAQTLYNAVKKQIAMKPEKDPDLLRHLEKTLNTCQKVVLLIDRFLKRSRHVRTNSQENGNGLLALKERFHQAKLKIGTKVVDNLKSECTEQIMACFTQGIDVSTVSKAGITALTIACSRGMDKLAFFLLEKGADCSKGTPLIYACHSGSKMREVIWKLIEKGADVNATYNGYSALSIACLKVSGGDQGMEAVVRKLIEAQADIHAIASNGDSVLSWACSANLEDLAIELVNRGVEINAVNSMGFTPLSIACLKGMARLALHLLKKNADVSKDALLAHACQSGSAMKEVIWKFIEKGVDINAKNKNGGRALFLALQKIEDGDQGMEEVVRKLIQSQADIHAVDLEGNSVLSWVCSAKLEDLAIELVNRGVEINAVNSMGFMPLSIACLKGMARLALHLLEKNADISKDAPLVHACQSGSAMKEVIWKLIEKGVDVNSKDKDGNRALFVAFEKASDGNAEMKEIICKLIASKADIHAVDKNGVSVFSWACQLGFEDIAIDLIKQGVDINKAAADGKTALYFATESKLSLVVDKLLEMKVIIDPQYADEDGDTLFMKACDAGLENFALQLIEMGTDVHKINQHRENGFFMACLSRL
ncbi:MAG: ankyrin repeat-containing protein, partial [Chlamydiia bacterium]|nr:ankyrin repeat-containing protein [Chlamydiia bacterium]